MSNPPKSQATPRPRRAFANLAATLVVVAVAILRLWHCLQLPANTGDALRHLQYGLLVLERGMAVADIPLGDIVPPIPRVSWSFVAYNYPVLSLGFDAAVARIWPSLFAAKVVLTFCEAACALLLWLWMKEKWLAILYWASPLSIWWVSREGQFEPLQNLLAIVAIGLFQRKKPAAWLLLSLAIQVKLFAVFLLPWFLHGLRNRAGIYRALLWFLAGFIPTIVASLHYGAAVSFLRSNIMYYNPYSFVFLDQRIVMWMSAGLRAWCQAASYGMLVALCILAWRRGPWEEYIPALAFLFAVKLSSNAQFWYMAVVPVLLLAIQDRRVRFLLFVLTPLLDGFSLQQFFLGPSGYAPPPELYAGLTVFSRISLLP